MTTQSSQPRRVRRPSRRFSVGATWSGAPLSLPPLRGRRRDTSNPATADLTTLFHHPDSSDGDLLPSSSEPHSGLPLEERESRTPLIYASLPPTPISPSPPTPYLHSPSSPLSPSFPSNEGIHQAPFSLWDYLREELLATDFDSHQELKWERVSNFLSIPLAMEKVHSKFIIMLSYLNLYRQIIGFGFILCLDSFMYTFTILPIRFTLALYRLIVNFLFPSSRPLPPSQKADLLRTLLLIISVMILIPLTDASKIYHTIRGQDTIKLYVIFNALEVRLHTIMRQQAQVS